MSDLAPRTERPRRRFWALSLRGLMILVVIVGGLLGWQARRISIQRWAAARIKAVGGTVIYDFEVDADGNYRTNPEPWAPAWLRRIAGDELFQEVAGLTISAPMETPRDIDDVTVEALAGLTGLDTVNFSNTTLSDRQLARVLTRSRPRHLGLINDQITPAVLHEIPAILAVEDLLIEFNHRFPGSACLPPLARMSRLKKLMLSKVDLSAPDSLTDLRSLTQLESLSLDRSPRDEACLTHLLGLSALKNLVLPKTRVSDAGLQLLTHLTHLERLMIDGSGLTDAGLEAVASWSQLTMLHLRQNDVRAIDFAVARGLLTDTGLTTLSRLTRLTDLNLPGRRFTDAGLAALGTMPALIRLDLDGVEATTVGVQALLANPRFRFLVLLGPSVADDWIPLFASQKQLSWLGLIGPQITDEGMVAVAALTGLRNLDVAGTRITDTGLATLARSTARWRYVIAFRTGVTRAGADAFRAARPGSQLIWETPRPDE